LKVGEIINNIITRIILSILLAIELILILVVTHVVYNGVINVDIYVVIIIPVIFFNIYLWEKAKQRGWLVRLIALQVILLFIFPTIFWLFKPHYTFLQAKNEVTQKTEFLNGYKVQDKRYVNIKMYNSPNFFVKFAYFIEVLNENGVKDHIIFDSISGKYKFFD
jgi:hypothetical protein